MSLITDKHRRAIMARDYPHIPLSVEDKVEAGEVIVLKPNQVWVTILGVGRDRRKALYLRYKVHDSRPRLIRRNPHGMDTGFIRRNLDRYGTPRSVSEQDEAAAEETSHYTSSEHLALRDAGEAVPVEYQNVLTIRARSEQADRDAQERALELAKRQARSINESIRDVLLRRARLGLPAMSPALADLQRAERRLLAEIEEEEAA